MWGGDPIVDCAAMTAPSVPFTSRIGLAFRVLFDGIFAARLLETEPEALPAPAAVPTHEGLQLLALLQREGRFVDFVEQDIASFPDADIGAAARVVHEGCRRALHAHARVVSVRSEAEGSRIELAQASPEVKLVGNVAGSAPYRGVLRHRGWRIEGFELPKVVGAHDASVVAAAELELS